MERKQTYKQVERMFIQEMNAKSKEEIDNAKWFAKNSYNENEVNE